jgi:hypothetical protein
MKGTCPECGSSKVVPGVPLLDHYGDVGAFNKQAAVAVHGKPQAWMFKDTTLGALAADVCGECGHVVLRVSNFKELYAKYRTSQGG